MGVMRANDGNYTKISVDIFDEYMSNIELSWKAKGILTYMHKNPIKIYNEYDFVIEEKDKYTSIINGLKELLKHGYIKKISKNINGYCLRNLDLPKISDKSGFVYVITYGDEKYFKIGLSSNIGVRMKSYITSLPTKIKIINIIFSLDMYKTEKILHDKFSSKNSNGEWFVLSKEDLIYLKDLGGAINE
ncbi:GIY-YIG nuclease family protein [Clostridium sp. MSJ-11]|uniref:GIY-YIG nuclease family protein n=1 Tax=Clostridium mobile TaxID=2841512 RepID=A0ABS6EMI5_9CLOT|nr:GIY-YIG nuclease family protein [Clostridium mobile]MBU5486443.1 GIY-YIG nuclease family protein [Clostridium mobile]